MNEYNQYVTAVNKIFDYLSKMKAGWKSKDNDNYQEKIEEFRSAVISNAEKFKTGGAMVGQIPGQPGAVGMQQQPEVKLEIAPPPTTAPITPASSESEEPAEEEKEVDPEAPISSFTATESLPGNGTTTTSDGQLRFIAREPEPERVSAIEIPTVNLGKIDEKLDTPDDDDYEDDDDDNKEDKSNDR